MLYGSLCMYIHIPFVPWMRHGKVEAEGQLKEKERSVISGGPLAGQLSDLKIKVPKLVV